MIYIRPDYSFLHKCHYCQKNIATNGKEVSQTMYRVVKSKTFPVGYSYIKAKIDIPRCETCARKQNIVDSIGFIIFVIISVCVGLFLYENDNEWFTGFWHILFGIFVSCLISSIPTGIIVYLLSYLQSLKSKQMKSVYDIDNYGPIRLLISDKWLKDKPDPSTKGYGYGDSYSEEKTYKILEKIKLDFKCRISRG